MGRSLSRRERVADVRPVTADLRGEVEDFVAAGPSADFEGCVATLAGSGYALPPRDGWERLRELWMSVMLEMGDPRAIPRG